MNNRLSFKNFFIEDSIELNWEYIMSIPEFKRMIGCKQPARWHAEGDVYNHLKLCIDEAYILIKTSPYLRTDMNHSRIVLMGVLFHDIGKPDTTEYKKDEWHSYGHDMVGEKITRRILWEEDVIDREQVCALVRWHMDAYYLIKKGNPIERIVDMSYKVNIADLMFVHECDIRGSITPDENDTNEPLMEIEVITELANKLGCYNNILKFKYNNLCSIEDRDKISRRFFYHNTCPYGKRYVKETRVTILIGLPGSGKDTYVKKNYPDDIILCRDDIRVELGYCKEGKKIVGTKEQEKKVTEVFNSRLNDAIKSGKNVVLNNINLYAKYREEYRHTYKNEKIHWEYVYLQSPSFEETVKRRKGQIGKDVLKSMITNLDWPQPKEYDTFKVVKQEFDENENIVEHIRIY